MMKRTVNLFFLFLYMKDLNNYIVEKLRINKDSKLDKRITPFIEKLISFLYLDKKDDNEFIEGLIDVFNGYKFDDYTIAVGDHDATGNVKPGVFAFSTYTYKSTNFLWWEHGAILFQSNDGDVKIKKARGNLIGIMSYKTHNPIVIKYEDDK